MIDRRSGPLLAAVGAALTLAGGWSPWYVVDGADAGHNGFSFVGGLVAMTLVVAGVTTAFGPKRRPVPDPRQPVALGAGFAAGAVVIVLARAALTPGPPSAAAHVHRQYGLWLTLLGAALTVVGLLVARRSGRAVSGDRIQPTT